MRKTCILLMVTALVLIVFASCSPEMWKNAVSISFSSESRSINAVPESFDKDSYYWKYAARMTLTEASENGGKTPSYDEDGAVFLHETVPGLEGQIGGFSEGTWDFLLFGYKRSGEEGNYTYSLVYSGEATGVKLVKGSLNMVDVRTAPVTDHGNGYLFVDMDHIVFNPSSEKSQDVVDFTRTVTVTRLSDSLVVTSDDYLYDVQPDFYLVNIRFIHGGYIYAEGSVVATVYSNQTVTVSGNVNELVTFAALDIPTT